MNRDGDTSVMGMLREASRHGAAWPPDVLTGSHLIAQACGMLSLVKGRGARLAGVAGGLRSIREPLSTVDGIQSQVWRHQGMRDEILETSARLNSVVLWLSAEARAYASGPTTADQQARDQFMAWWLQLGDSLYGYNRDVVPLAMVEQLPTLIRELVRQYMQALAVPVVQMPPGSTLPGLSPLGGGGGGGGSAGGSANLGTTGGSANLGTTSTVPQVPANSGQTSFLDSLKNNPTITGAREGAELGGVLGPLGSVVGGVAGAAAGSGILGNTAQGVVTGK